MPIIDKGNGVFNVSGLEFNLHQTLHYNLRHNIPIDDVLKRINQTEDRQIIINLKDGYPVSLENSDLYSAVHVASLKGNVDALRLLSKFSASFDCFSSEYGESPLHLAARNKHINVIEYLIREKQIAVDTPLQHGVTCQNKNTALFVCVVHGCIETAEKLIGFGAKVNFVNSEGMTPLHYACKYGFGWNKPNM